MSSYEYTVIPAPARGEKTKGAKTGIERFAATLAEVLNDMARDGWDYVRAETLPAEERSGLTGRSTVYHNLLVFRRALAPAKSEPVTATRAEPAPMPAAMPAPELQPETPEPAAKGPFSAPMRATARPEDAPRARNTEPPLTAPEPALSSGLRLGPASR